VKLLPESSREHSAASFGMVCPLRLTHPARLQSGDNFNNIVKNLRTARSLGIETNVSVRLHSGNIQVIGEMVDLASDLGCEQLLVESIIPSGRGRSHIKAVGERLKYLPIARKALADRVSSLRRDESHVVRIPGTRREESAPPTDLAMSLFPCGVGVWSVCVRSNGDVFPCPGILDDSFNMGNMLREPLDGLWERSTILRQLRRHNKEGIPECEDCVCLDSCRTGCRARALHLCGSVGRRDPAGCAYWKGKVIELEGLRDGQFSEVDI